MKVALGERNDRGKLPLIRLMPETDEEQMLLAVMSRWDPNPPAEAIPPNVLCVGIHWEGRRLRVVDLEFLPKGADNLGGPSEMKDENDS